MVLTRRILLQFAVFTFIAAVAIGIMVFGYMKLPNLLWGAGHYKVTLQLPETGGLYPRSNVTYRGTQVGRVESIHLDERGGVSAILSLTDEVKIPSDLEAQVHSQTAIGELFVELLPRADGGPYLRNGDVIASDRTTVPPDVNSLLDATNRGLDAIRGRICRPPSTRRTRPSVVSGRICPVWSRAPPRWPSTRARTWTRSPR